MIMPAMIVTKVLQWLGWVFPKEHEIVEAEDIGPIAFGPDGTIYLGGEFTTWPTANTKTAGVAIWDGGKWSEKRWKTTAPCEYCGTEVLNYVYACPQCSAPTASWWSKLDGMLIRQQGTALD